MGRYFLMFFVLLSSAVFAQDEVTMEQPAVETSQERVVEAERQEEKEAELATCPRKRRISETNDLLACGNCPSKSKKIA